MNENNSDLVNVGYHPSMVARFGHAPRRGKTQPLDAHIYQPGDKPMGPMVVFFHAGGFRSGRIDHSAHRVIARWLTKSNISVSFPQYRLGARREDLSGDTKSSLKQLRSLASPGFPANFRRAAALAALEDAARFLNWLETKRSSLGFKGKIVVAGSSAGAITALNLVYLPRTLGLKVPPIGGVISYSGGFAFPSLADGNNTPVSAVHGPKDDRVPIESMTELARRNTAVSLTVSEDHEHGSLRLSPDESKKKSFERFISNVEKFSW